VTKVQKLSPFGALAIMFLAVAWSFLPFDFAEGVRCGPPLLGGKPESEQPVGLILPEQDCLAKAKSRLLVSSMISLAAIGTATAVVALKPITGQCSRGDHEDCPAWWANLLSENDSGFGCQCECHSN
jgi:hypothetical protein